MTLLWNICGLWSGWFGVFTYGMSRNHQENDKVRYATRGQGFDSRCHYR